MNENGVFSFIDPWMFSHPNRFPTTFIPTRQGHVLSPFWSDVDIRREGTVRYVPITRGTSDLGDMIIDQASEYVNGRFVNGNGVTFRPTWTLVAQWDGVHPHPHGADDHEGIDEEYLDRVCMCSDIHCCAHFYLLHYLPDLHPRGAENNFLFCMLH